MVCLVSDGEAIDCPKVSWGLNSCLEDQDTNRLRCQTILAHKSICIRCRHATYKVCKGGLVKTVDGFGLGGCGHLYLSNPKSKLDHLADEVHYFRCNG